MPDWFDLTQYIPQSQYYEQDWTNQHHSSQSQWGYNSPESYGQKFYQHPPSYTSLQNQFIEEKSDLEKIYQAFLEYIHPKDSQAHQDFQIQDPYTNFQVPPQEEEPRDLDRSMQNLIQSENYFSQSLNRLEAQMSPLIK